VKEGLKCRLVIEEVVPNSDDPMASGNHFMYRLMGVESISVAPAGTDMAAAMQRQADALAAVDRKGYVIPRGRRRPFEPSARSPQVACLQGNSAD
jgi:D-cysteine desulfhydrase